MLVVSNRIHLPRRERRRFIFNVIHSAILVITKERESS